MGESHTLLRQPIDVRRLYNLISITSNICAGKIVANKEYNIWLASIGAYRKARDGYGISERFYEFSSCVHGIFPDVLFSRNIFNAFFEELGPVQW